MKQAYLIIMILFLSANVKGEVPVNTLYDFTVKNAVGENVSLADYSGGPILIVNVASKCGFTPQYEGLQKLYEKYGEQGLQIIGFPANNFMNQEPGTNAEIQEFCSVNFGVSFPVMEKISVRGNDIHPLYAWLTDESLHPDTGGKIGWNFTKFLISPNGEAVARFSPRTKPLDRQVTEAIEKYLEAE